MTPVLHTPAPSSQDNSHQEGELWLLRPGPLEARGALIRALAVPSPALVLCAPDGGCLEWAAAFTTPRARLVRSPALRERDPNEGQEALGARAWAELRNALAAGHPRCLAVLELDVLRAALARALCMPPERASALRIDPGCLAMLRGDPLGPLLRRLNVLAPESRSGTPLPSGPSGPEVTRSSAATP